MIEKLLGPRTRYRTVWTASVSALTAIGVVAAFVFIRTLDNLIVLAMAVATSASIHFSAGLAREEKPRALVVPVLTLAFRVALGALAVCGYTASVGASVLLLLLVVAGTSPGSLRYLSEPQMKPPDRTAEILPTPVPPLEPLTDFSVLPVEELCLMWRHTFASLQKSATDEVRLAVVSARDRVLDELERRDPQAFAEWLESGPRAAGDPTRYFTH